MKNINDRINESINEGRQVEYQAAFIGPYDVEGLPIGVTILVDKENQKAFEEWAAKEEGNTFAHFGGGSDKVQY